MEEHGKRKGILAGLFELLGEEDEESPRSFPPDPAAGDARAVQAPPATPQRTESSDAPGIVTDPPLPPGREHPGTALLGSPDPADRLRGLHELASREIDDASASALVDRLVHDPDEDVRLGVLDVLAHQPPERFSEALRQALRDPADGVRARAAEQFAGLGAVAIGDLVKLVGLPHWPHTQQIALEALPGLIMRARPEDVDLDDLLGRIAHLESLTVTSGRAGFAALAGACGRERLIQALQLSDERRLGAARLLVEEGAEPSLDAVAELAGDELEDVQVLAALARSMLRAGPRERHAAEATTPSAVEVRVAAADEMQEPAAAFVQSPPPHEIEAPAARQMPVPPQAPTVTPDGDRLYGEEPPPLPAQGPRARTELFGGLARALADPDEIVRERALDALAGARGLLPWVRSELRIGDRENAESAAAVVQVLGLNEAAGDLLERASGLPRELRGAFIDALAAIRLEASELAELARSVEVSRRHEAVRLVGEIGGAAVAPYMKSFLSESSGPVRIAALELLGRSPGPDLRDVAEQVLRKDSSPAVRATAVRVLGSIDDPEGRLRSLAQALNDADPDVRSTAVEALGTDTEAGAATLLLAAAEDDDERVRVAALRCLSHLRRDPKVMWSALVKSSEREREQMIAMLEDRGAEELGLLASEYLDSRNPDDRALAVTLAGRAGTPATIRKTIAALRDPEKAVRSAAAHALSELRTPEAIPALAYTLKDPDPGVRIQAVRALGVIDDDEVIPVLIDSLKDPEARVRDEASDVVQRWRSPAVARRLVQALSAGDLSRPASDLLARMGETALEPILERLPDCDPDFLPVLGELLSAIVGPDVFVDDLGSLDPDLRSRAVESLGAMGGAKAVDGLIRVLSDPDERIRKAALVHLGRLGDQRAYDEVRRAFANDPVLEVVEAAEETLHALEPGESFPQL